ncbi:SDR family oxidoreductase [Rhodobacteraceae bacterium 2376]|uniref:SDR family oxidoreductase n=1 Tax=Rhabdonatronobacter sediminivivens TaxID=2743469 RepID=A0A7Z0I122_9RHOB|nr:SDR family oxidoreductase [Rhabdonatronobacter sediminivivens]NYS25900.1 SDR family oxidoreductase [Rhabdonatronobacter sediminivivens]
MPIDTASLNGKSVLITGASRGIGAEAARAFARAGAKLGLAARSADSLAELAGETGALALPCDVADYASVTAAVARMESEHGRLDVLINNAGVIDPIAPIADSDPEAWGQLIDINIKGVFHGMRAALPGMIARGGGTIITVGSGAAYNPLEGWAAYCTSKAGALMLGRVADVETRGRGIRVLSLSPGTVATNMQERIRDSGINAVSQLDWSAHIPPEWPAQALLWMCTADADGWIGREVSLREEPIRKRLGLIS